MAKERLYPCECGVSPLGAARGRVFGISRAARSSRGKPACSLLRLNDSRGIGSSLEERRPLWQRLGHGLLILALMAGSLGVGMGITPLKVAAETRSAYLHTFLHVYDVIRHSFIDRAIPESLLEYGAIRGMLDSLDDPYTRFLEPEVFRSMLAERDGANSGAGIGIQLGLREKELTVIAPFEDAPAFGAGIKSGDMLLEVDGKTTKGMAIEEAVSRIRGPRGTKVKLLIKRAGTPNPFTVSVVRDNIVMKAVKTKELDGGIGYIRLSTFMSGTVDQEMREALEKFGDKKALLLDLRDNPGGLLTNAVQIGLMFIDKGPIVQIVDRDGTKEKLPNEGQMGGNKPFWPKTKPLAVLVNQGSGGASEILGGALQDSRSAVLIGTKTFGKGLVQTVYGPLEGGAGLAVTTHKYLTPSGSGVAGDGISPDLEIPQTANLGAMQPPGSPADRGPDPHLEAAVALLTGRATLAELARRYGGSLQWVAPGLRIPQ